MSATKKADHLKELRAADETALNAQIENARREIYGIRRSRLSQQETNVRATRAHRKEIARILTIKRQREIAQQGQG
jgi:ribosomal protein L29